MCRRDSALNDLASAYSDMQAMQAALLDSALYVRFLRAKLLEAQLAEHRSDGFGMQSAFLRVLLHTRRDPAGCAPWTRADTDSALRCTAATGLEVGARHAGASCSAAAAPEAKAEPMAFSFEKTKTAIRTAIKEAAGLEKGERLKRVRQLRLRWHPGAPRLHHAVVQSPCAALMTWCDICASTLHGTGAQAVLASCRQEPRAARVCVRSDQDHQRGRGGDGGVSAQRLACERSGPCRQILARYLHGVHLAR